MMPIRLIPCSYGIQRCGVVWYRGRAWFLAVDAARILGLGDPAQVVSRLSDTEKIPVTFVEEGLLPATYWAISRDALYGVAMASNAPDASAFKQWGVATARSIRDTMTTGVEA